MSINIVGFDSTIKIPGYFAETVYNAGPVTAGSLPLLLLLVGTMTSAGSATPNQDIKFITSANDADAFFGPGSELAVKCYGALQIPGVTIWAAATAEAGGSVASTATITVSGSWTVGGTYNFRVDGVQLSANALSTDTPASFAATIASAIAGNAHLSATAAVGGGPSFPVTLTRKSKGLRGNQGALYQDVSQIPSGMSVAIAGGAAMTGPGVHFTGGAGTESVATLLASVIQATQFDRISIAQNDAANGALWHTFLNNQAAPLTGLLQHAVLAVNGTYSAAVSLAQATLNAERMQMLWQNDGETIPSFLAATFAANRCATEQGDPDAAYDGYALPGVAPQSQSTDWPNTSTLIGALNSGVTPVTTNAGGQAVVVRSITSHSQDPNGNPQYTTLDTSEAVVPDYVRLSLRLYYTSVFKPSNPRVGPDPDPTQKKAPAGFATPSLWRQHATADVLVLLEQASPPILLPGSTAQNPVIAEYNAVAQRLMSIVPVIPCPNDHQLGVSVRNVTAA